MFEILLSVTLTCPNNDNYKFHNFQARSRKGKIITYSIKKCCFSLSGCFYFRVTLDTPMNRKGMPNADFSSWTTLDYIARYVLVRCNCIFIINSVTVKY